MLDVTDVSARKVLEALEKANCIEGDRIYIPTFSKRGIEDNLIMNFCNLDSGFAKLSEGYTCIYRGGGRNTKQNGIMFSYEKKAPAPN